MPQFTAPVTAEGWELQVMIGLPGHEMARRRAAGTPIPAPLLVGAVVDSASTRSCISARVANQLGLISWGDAQLTTAGGVVTVAFYEASLFIPVPGDPGQFVAVADDLIVTELGAEIAKSIDAIVGRDVQAKLLAFLNGPLATFTLAG
jgi:hypothetical protein